MSHCNNKRSILVCGIMFLIAVNLVLCLVLLSPANGRPDLLISLNNSDPTKDLKLVHTVFRHGPRTPADTYPTDPYFNETFYPYGWGQLTNNGKEFLYETGRWLKNRYGSYLGEYYIPDEVWAQATGVTRTFMSMATLLASLYPPKGTPMEWSKELNWQPIPIFSQPLDEDNLLLVRTSCPRYYEALADVFKLPEIQEILQKNENMFNELSKITGMSIKTPDDIQSLYSTLRAEQEYGLKLPEWTKKYYPEQLLPLTEKSYIYNVYTDELKKIKGGPFLKKMINEWKLKKENNLKPKDRKIFLYAGHDSTVVNILSAINVWAEQVPVYGIMAIFELLEDLTTGEYGIQIYLRNNATSGATPLTIPGCDHFCPLDNFIELTKNVIPDDLTKACEAKDKNFVTPPSSGP